MLRSRAGESKGGGSRVRRGSRPNSVRVPRAFFDGTELDPGPQPAPVPTPSTGRLGQVLTYCAWLLGWQAVTAAIAAWSSPWVWALSEGLLLLCAGGLRPLQVVVTLGLHELAERARALGRATPPASHGGASE